mgnify:CR=1 FL=1
MNSLWPRTEVLNLPELEAQGIRLKVGVVIGQSRWSSTSVKGSVGGSVYNGNGGVSGSISSTVTDHQRVFVHFPQDGVEVAFEWDEWDFNVREGHRLALAIDPQQDERACFAYNFDTRQVGPKQPIKTGAVVANVARTFRGDLWFWRFLAAAVTVTPAAFFSLMAINQRGDEGAMWFCAIFGVLGTLGAWTFLAGPLARGAKRVYQRRLGRRVRKALLPHAHRLAESLPRLECVQQVSSV